VHPCNNRLIEPSRAGDGRSGRAELADLALQHVTVGTGETPAHAAGCAGAAAAIASHLVDAKFSEASAGGTCPKCCGRSFKKAILASYQQNANPRLTTPR